METETAAAAAASPLTTLEERILKAVELVSQLRKDNAALTEARDQALASLAVAEKQIEALRSSSQEAQGESERLTAELETLRGEQKQVRQRVEKLLEMIDSLGA